MTLPKCNEIWFRKLRAEWFRRMRPYGSWVPPELRDEVQLNEVESDETFWGDGMISRAPLLSEKHLRECRVVPDRTALLGLLPQGGIVAEVGVLHGNFSRKILQIVQPDELHLIDVKIEPAVKKMIRKSSFRDKLHVHKADSVDALEAFPDEYFDWIYIDALHSYEGVKRDTEVARRKVNAEGFLVFNDYTMWSYLEMEPYGVVASVNELCIEHDWKFVYLALSPNMYCDVAVRRINL